MSWVADLHIHSHFSMATSKECNPLNLYRWAALKGVALVGTGDFTHPGWRAELRENLRPAEQGFYRLKQAPAPEIPGQPEVRFVVTGELSTIYKKNGRTRKVHHLVVLPSLEAADVISDRLETLGMNIRSDGRPILGLDSYLLLQLVLESAPEAIFIPAHIWTPHFSVFGSNSGFDDFGECYEDLASQIFALETGLSSDPPMNWRWSALDRFNLVSNSDAHNPQNLAREANIFSGEFSYCGLRAALADRDSAAFAGTLEFFPEEGKYHLDGHRNCQICWEPEETKSHGAICPVCGKKVTVGVAARVLALADRPEGFRPANAKDFLSLVPLREVIGAAYNVGAKTQKVERAYGQLLHDFGPELDILTRVDPDLISGKVGALVATGIRRLRKRQVLIKPGYDGEYGVISLFDEAERREILGQGKLFTIASPRKKAPRAKVKELIGKKELQCETAADWSISTKVELSPEQRQVVAATQPVIRVIAGPGTGKTKTLVERIAWLIRDGGADPAAITAVTFTNKAAAEIKTRVERQLSGEAGLPQIQIGTFHSLAWQILNCNPAGQPLQLVDRAVAEVLVAEVLQEEQLPYSLRDALRHLGLIKNQLGWEEPDSLEPQLMQLYHAYQQKLALFGRCDFDDILCQAVVLWEAAPEWLEPYRRRFTYLLVDEFQDVNPLQYRLVKQWTGDSRSLMVIGDPNQSIYGFRGSHSRFFTDLETDFEAPATFRLTRNYRATASLIRAANSLIAPELHQMVPAEPQPDRRSGLTWLKTGDAQQAAAAVVQEIVRLIGGSTMLSAGSRGQRGINPVAAEAAYGFSDFALLYRTNRQAEALESALSAAGLPYRVVGPVETLADPTVQAFLSFCRYLEESADRYWLREALLHPVWGLEPAEQAQVKVWLRETGTVATAVASGRYLAYLLQRANSGALFEKLRHFHLRAQAFRSKLEQGIAELIDAWIELAGVTDLLELEHLSRIAANYVSLRELLRKLPLATEADLSRSNQSGADRRELITLSTIHASKGLEYPVVFITGVEEGLLPFGNALGPEELAEETRLFYVALTRARERCYLVNSQRQFRSGELVTVEPSRYLRMLPQKLLQIVEPQVRPIKVKQLELFR
jgi:uncharacterized protein (TIGR00375 family)